MAVLLCALAGCVENGRSAGAPAPVPPPLLNEPIGVQLARRDARLAGVPFRVLLDFENAHDLAFVRQMRKEPGAIGSSPVPASAIDSGRAHTGRASMVMSPALAQVNMNLSSIMPESLPGKWTMVGGYFYSETPVTISLAFKRAKNERASWSNTATLAANQWTRVLIDLSANASPEEHGHETEPGILNVAILGSGDVKVYCDDLMFINNDVTFLEISEASTPSPAVESRWTIHQRGFTTTVDRPNRFNMRLMNADGSNDGWKCVEANEVRAQFVTASGKSWMIYTDGRSVQEKQLVSMFKSADPQYKRLLAEQHDQPAAIEVDEEFGRVNRESDGDLHNSGYNSARAAYLITSVQKTRLEFKITPKTPQMVNPVFEIAGLQKGTPVILVAGKLIDRHAWLADGRLLFEIPLALSRETTVNISVK